MTGMLANVRIAGETHPRANSKIRFGASRGLRGNDAKAECYTVRVRAATLFPSGGRQSWSVGEWLSLVEHLVRDQGVGGSNPLSPTISNQVLADTRRAGEQQALPQKDLHWSKREFTPTASGEDPGILSISGNAPQGMQSVAFVGTGIPLSRA
jgi:hypothetical protein